MSELIAQILCAVSRAINRARLSAIRKIAYCRCLGDDFCSKVVYVLHGFFAVGNIGITVLFGYARVTSVRVEV